jgi:hypothetical protein
MNAITTSSLMDMHASFGLLEAVHLLLLLFDLEYWGCKFIAGYPLNMA